MGAHPVPPEPRRLEQVELPDQLIEPVGFGILDAESGEVVGHRMGSLAEVKVHPAPSPHRSRPKEGRRLRVEYPQARSADGRDVARLAFGQAR